MFKIPSFLLTMELIEDCADDSPLEDICKELFTTTVQLAVQSRSLDKQFTTLLKRVQEKPLGSILSPKAATGRWLQSIGLSNDMISYDDFITFFFIMYEREGRLDFATRTLELRATEAKLLELPSDQPISVFQFLGALPRIFN